MKAEFLGIMWTAPAMEAIQSGERYDMDVDTKYYYMVMMATAQLCTSPPTHDIQFDT